MNLIVDLHVFSDRGDDKDSDDEGIDVQNGGGIPRYYGVGDGNARGNAGIRDGSGIKKREVVGEEGCDGGYIRRCGLGCSIRICADREGVTEW